MASWFTDIAGKAENLLNAMDKSAATVLHQPSQSSSTTSTLSGGGGGGNGGHRSAGRYDYYTADGGGAEDMSETCQPSPRSLQQFYTIKTCCSLLVDPIITTTTCVVQCEDIPEESALLSVSTGAGHTGAARKDSGGESSSSSVRVMSSSASHSPSSPSPPAVSQQPHHPPDFEGRIKSLTGEISFLNRRNIELETDCKRLQKRVHNWVQQMSASDNTIRELQSRESDLTANLDAKDGQIAILKVRLQETDAELGRRLTQIQTLEQLNESLRTEAQSDTSTAADAVDDLRLRIRHLEAELERERDELRAVQTQTMAQIGRLEDNQKSLVDEISILQRQIAVEKAANSELEVRVKSSQQLHQDLDRDYQEFKAKASKTLADKDELIRALKSAADGTADGDGVDGGGQGSDDSVQRVLQSQCDAMVQEIHELREKYDTLRRQYDRCQAEEVTELSARVESLGGQLAGEQRARTDAELELKQAREESRYYQSDLAQSRQSLESRIGDRDVEIEKLRKQLVSKRSAGTAAANAEEYEERFRALTDNLIQKQTLVESLSSERHSLSLQLERSEQRLRDAMAAGGGQKGAEVAIGIHHSPSFTNLVNRNSSASGGGGGSVRPLMEDYPGDGHVTRRVKRAYGQIDAFSIRLGNFLRAYPSARAGVLVYIIILHLWVAFVLIYYEPEQHGPNYQHKMPEMVTD
ncbi:unnamed protein product [Medioppia subpectinata]|uniref:Golgin-84 n=1 Tax=Medioppia subpectinata TaxID=1979941 RepID=A0A7R9Q387_9ACAR|nr:unnamed protein product [Medioppia subpectinata]CAG2111158.1 unnamed protein product [Medioppia subpectinata]